MVDIREYYQDDCGELRPGKKGLLYIVATRQLVRSLSVSLSFLLGISLSLDQWKKLKDSMDAIEERIQGLG